MVKCSQCQKELVLEQVLYHSKILNGNHVEHVWCNAECSHKWHRNDSLQERDRKKAEKYFRKDEKWEKKYDERDME